ncbi:type IV secretion system protein VirB10 [Enterovibrio nigricans]|uniref:Type IV secretion system protein VirB10 n=1 Tax=Enterovibrio nigricans DSM 22720 TaxID=1121868 RepID=A0A1T4V8I8_9GAMM|nr:type IV secretion system protein VirB10 [Enterovibrio nigricans]PKF50219.1 type IV secretion system protein VirB10 [Enterovibrio nigricans]SKA61269.1 type IV secretion system protein VirB10 [Enterovibrio nigricans DSM 22720]
MTEQNEELNGEDLLNEGQPDRKKIAVFVAVCLLVIAGIGAFLWFSSTSPKEPQKAKTNHNISTTATTSTSSSRSHAAGRTFEFEDDQPKETPPPPTPKEVTSVETPKEPPHPPSNDKSNMTPIKKIILLDKSSASSTGGAVQSGSGGGLGLVPQSPNTLGTQTTDSFNLFSGEQDNTGLRSQLTATKTDKALAGVLYNRNYLLAKGAYIDCVLNTSMNSTVAGMTKCTLTRNIYSDNGTTLLLERGSEVTGEYRANVSQGQSRLFVLWDRVKTPHGVVIDLASPATDSLGAGGVDGYVETHFWKRFGGAMMLSLVDDIAAYVATNGGQNVNNFESSSDAAQNMAAIALQNTINIPPTFYKNQGERVGIVVARDLDFSTVYQLRANP